MHKKLLPQIKPTYNLNIYTTNQLSPKNESNLFVGGIWRSSSTKVLSIFECCALDEGNNLLGFRGFGLILYVVWLIFCYEIILVFVWTRLQNLLVLETVPSKIWVGFLENFEFLIGWKRECTSLKLIFALTFQNFKP